MLKLEDTRHPLFARYLRQWGKLWTRGHAYQLAIKRDLKRVERLVRQLRATEVETGGEWQGRPDRIWQRQGARRRELPSILSQNRRKMHKRGYPPHPGITTGAGMLLTRKEIQKGPLYRTLESSDVEFYQ